MTLYIDSDSGTEAQVYTITLSSPRSSSKLLSISTWYWQFQQPEKILG